MQVFINLLGNANKFTPNDGTIEFHLKLDSNKDNVVKFSGYVKDNGIGISPENQKKLFNIFEQADSSTTRKFGGTGLGLAISKKIVELMGGTIWIESKENEGSKFLFNLALELDTNVVEEEDSNEIELDKDYSNFNILIAEDVPINLEIILSILEDTKIKIDTAENGLIALETFKKNHAKYSLIFMDLQMPEMDGLTSTREIRKLSYGKKIPIVAMTANVFKEDVDRCIEAGMNGHIGKPIDLFQLYKVLAKYLK
jgi:CheY-like chemotaxis protein